MAALQRERDDVIDQSKRTQQIIDSDPELVSARCVCNHAYIYLSIYLSINLAIYQSIYLFMFRPLICSPLVIAARKP